MKLQGRDLKPNLRGDDVAALQAELGELELRTEITDPPGFFGATTLAAVREAQARARLPVTGVVDAETARRMDAFRIEARVERFVVRGQVRDPEGVPLPGLAVELWAQGMRRTRPLGDGRTDRAGEYSIDYEPPERPFGVVVHARRPDEEEAAVTSDLICAPRPIEVVDLTVGGAYRGPSELAALRARLEPILAAEHAALERLEAEDVDWLACVHGLDARHVAYLVASARLARETELGVEAFYGLVRQGLPTALEALVAQSRRTLQQALEASVRDNIVSASLREQIPVILRRLEALIPRLALREPTPDRPTFRTLLDAAGVAPERHERILTAYTSRPGTVAEFWDSLLADPDTPDEEVEALRYTVGAATVALSHPPLVRELVRRRRGGQLGAELRDLARLSERDWRELIETERGGERIGAPAVLGEDASVREERYAQLLARLVETLFPTQVLRHRLAEHDAGTFAPTIAFLERNPGFDFRTDSISQVLQEHPDEVGEGDAGQAARRQLAAVQRMARIAPQFDKVRTVALIRDGLDSAFAIRRIGPTRFIRSRAEALGGSEEAQRVYARAALRADTALMLLGQSSYANPTAPGIIAPHLFGQGIPDLEDLFGSLDRCRCEHCASVYSPAAYLVDLLHFLMQRGTQTPGRSALDVLFDRRGDIGGIDLDCHNTLTELPHVDLVNEILEHSIAPGGGFPFQTEGEAAWLAAHPEHVNEQAYTVLREAVYPWNLPFDLWTAEARSYLPERGIERHALMARLQPGEAGESVEVAAEYLGLTPAERRIVTGQAEAPLRELWGLTAGELEQLLDDRRAAVVLERSGLTYDDLVELLEQPFVHQGASMRVAFEGASCDLETATVVGLTPARMDRMHRFVRLQRKLGWSPRELGRTLSTLELDELDDAALLQLARVSRLAGALQAPLATLWTWWSPVLRTARDGDPVSPYERVFEDPSVLPPELEIFALDEAGEELANAGLPIADHAAAVATALGVAVPDLFALVAQELPDGALSLANLSRLYKAATLARALRLPVQDYLRLRALTGIDPFAGVPATARFVEQAGLVAQSGFSLDVLDALLRHRLSPAGGLDDAAAAELLGRLRTGLAEIAAEHAVAPDPTGDRTKELLARVLPAERVHRAHDVIAGTSTLSPAEQAAIVEQDLAPFLDPAEAIAQLVDPGPPETPEAREARFAYVLGALSAHLRRVASESLVIESLAATFAIAPPVTSALLRELVPSTDPAAPDGLSTFLAPAPAPAELAEQVATLHRLAKVVRVAQALDLAGAAEEAEEIEAEIASIRFLIERGPELGWPDLIALPLEPQQAVADAYERWAKLTRTLRAVRDRPGGIAGFLALLAELPELDRSAFLDRLAERFGWGRADLDFLTGPDAFDLELPEELRDGEFVTRLAPAFRVLELLGVSAEEASRWAAPDLEPAAARAVARAIKQAARARYDSTEQWLAAARPIRDELREQQRAALVAHRVHTIRLIIPVLETPHPRLAVGRRGPAVKELQLKLNAAGAHPPLEVDGVFGPRTRVAVRTFQDAHGLDADGIVGAATWAALDQVRQRLRGPNDLYAHFLIDVEMDPCMLTSRLVLATQSVQLFVQRCLLNLEPEVELSPEDAKEWEWMKHYRVWEANRKVFLYPENWIEPELRDDKSPLFAALESGLLQDEPSRLTVEREYLKYLRGLYELSHLGIAGHHREWEQQRDLLHVVGRTKDSPHIYYYRRWVDQRYWTPWERIDIDIEGDHVLPVIWNRRLFLAWPIFVERASEALPGPDSASTPDRYYEIRLGLTERRAGEWLPKQVSSEAFTTRLRDITAPEQLAFWAQVDEDGQLVIACESERRPPGAPTRMVGAFIVSGGPEGISVGAVDHVEIARPAATKPRFNKHCRRSRGALELTVDSHLSAPDAMVVFVLPPPVEDGFNVLTPSVQMREQIVDDSEIVLETSPTRFCIVPPHAERPLLSRAPFFYEDARRTFLVVPRGKYAGGSNRPVGLTVELNPGAIPLELPDVVHGLVLRRRPSSPEGAPGVAPGRSAAAPLAIVGEILSPTAGARAGLAPLNWVTTSFEFMTFYHPFVGVLIAQLNRHGIDGVLRPDPEQETGVRRQLARELRRQGKSDAFFNAEYAPVDDHVVNVMDLSAQEKAAAGPLEEFDFTYGGAYAGYNWELFFHIPFLIARRLSAHQRFAEAHRWYHYIFNPTERAPEDSLDELWPERVWQIKPFFEHGRGTSIERAMLLLRATGLTKGQLAQRKSLQQQIDAWRADPFKPHLIARLRPEAYMKAVVMAYLDNLIAWGDHLFRQDTRETINEATQLYILAAELLGPRPPELRAHTQAVPTAGGQEVRTFDDLRGHLDAFSNVLIELETRLYPMELDANGGGIAGAVGSITALAARDRPGSPFDSFAAAEVQPEPGDDDVFNPPLAAPVPAVLGPSLFFCIPRNDELLRYWDTVADRLFKIRHCMNIEGVTRQLSLFSPPIDPALLVKAAAAGVPLGSVLSDLNAPPPHHRFRVLAQKANEILGEVKSLGAGLLAALERRDAEELAALRSTQEVELLTAARSVRVEQLAEAKAARAALEASVTIVEQRRQFYEARLEEDRIPGERTHLDKLEEALRLQLASMGIDAVRSFFGAMPDFDIGIEGAASSPTVKASWGGSNIMSMMGAISQSLATAAYNKSHEASKALTEAGYARRREDWTFQVSQAKAELAQLDKQLVAAALRIAIAERDLTSSDLQIEKAKAVDAYLRDKYTSQELYGWMLSQLSGVYFQSYQLAYDLAKRAERAFRHELGVEDTSYLQFGYWDSLKKGLLAGEQLQLDLRRMEVAYLDQDRREREITQHFSLALLDPEALLALRETGRCELELPELAFDLVYPGHYFRRIKSVSLTIPCVAGPHTNVGASLTLLSNRVRTNGSGQQAYLYTGLEDDNFRHDLVGVESIATSSARNDAGLFQLDFRDERYLPFEGAGAVSRFRLSLPRTFRSFDYDTIADVVLHLSYTARDGGDALRQTVEAHLAQHINSWLDELADAGDGLRQLLSLRREFPDALHRLLSAPAPEPGPRSTELRIGKRHLPFFVRDRDVTTTRVSVLLKLRDEGAADLAGLTASLDGVAGSAFAPVPDQPALAESVVPLARPIEAADAIWTLDLSGALPEPQAIADVMLLIGYRV